MLAAESTEIGASLSGAYVNSRLWEHQQEVELPRKQVPVTMSMMCNSERAPTVTHEASE